MDTLIPASDDALSEDDLAHHIARELNESLGLKESDVKQTRYEGMRYYYGELPKRPSEAGRSGIRSTDVADVCDALVAEILPMFTASDTLCHFDPVSAQDEVTAAAEARAINYVFFEDCDGASVIHDILKDGLLQRNSVAQVEVREDLKTATREVGPLTEQEVSILLMQHQQQHPQEAMEVIGGTDQEDGRSLVTLRRTWAEKTLCVDIHAPENTIVCQDHDSMDMDGARFVAFRVSPTRSDLVEMGIDYDLAYDTLPKWSNQRDYDGIARDRQADSNQTLASHKSGEKVDCYRCFYWIDADGDGVSELHDILFSKPKYILSDEIIDSANLASFSPWPVPHNWVGTGLVDKLEEIVKAKTVFLRQTVDNMVRCNNQRLVVGKGVDLASLLDSDPLAPIIARTPEDVKALVYPNVGQTGYQMLDYLDKMRREKVGSTLDVQTKGAQSQMVPGDTAHGVERMMTVLEKQGAQIANNLSSTLKSIFRCMHKLLRESDYGQITYAGEQGDMQQTNPGQWMQRTRVCVKLGLSEGRRMQKLGALESTLQKQMQMMQTMPGIIVTPHNIYETLSEQIVVAGLDSPHRYWQDPRSPPAQQAQQQQQQQQQMQAQMQAQMSERQLKLQEDLARATTENEELKIRLNASIQSNKQQLDHAKNRDDSAQGWTQLEIDARKDLGPEGRAHG